MGIYIPNVEKPKSCYNHCNFIAMEEVGCPLKDYTESHQYKDKIHPGCSLIDIVPCGECKWWESANNGWNGWCRKQIDAYATFYAEDFCSYGERKEK